MAYISKMTLPNGETYQLKDKEVRDSIPIKLSELENDAGFLTQHQDISGKADVSDLETHTQDTDIHISAAERQKWNTPSDWNQNDAAAADFIKNKPQIPSKVSDLQNDVGYLTEHQDISGKADIASVYTKDQIDAKFSSVMNYKGTVMSVSGLPNSGNSLGDVYHVNADGSEWAWNGETWEELGKTIDISGKVDKVPGKDLSTNDFTNAYKTKLDNIEAGAQVNTVDSVNGKTGVVVLDAEDVGALPADTEIPTVPTEVIEANTAARHTHENKAVLDGITAAKVQSWDGKGTYSKPSGGIPKSDLASAVQTSLGKADTALQTAPVTSVNNKTGAVTLTASDVGALPSSTSIPAKVSDLTNDSGFQTAPFEIEVTQSGSTYSTTASAADILAHQDNCVAVVYGTKIALSGVIGNEHMAELFFANLAVNEGAGYTMAQQISIFVNNGVVTVLADMMALEDIPSVTSADDGKFLRVVNGAWAAETVQAWQGGSY